MRVLSCCWPGLSGVWLRGDGVSLATAVSFAAGLNIALWLSFGSANPPSIAWRGVAWLVLASLWVGFCWRDYRYFLGPADGAPNDDQDDLLGQAQTEYLKGNWFEAEKIAQGLVLRAPRDFEAQLLLASIYRRMSRAEEALGCLASLARHEAAGKWELELSSERRALEASAGEENDSENGNPPEALARAA